MRRTCVHCLLDFLAHRMRMSRVEGGAPSGLNGRHDASDKVRL